MRLMSLVRLFLVLALVCVASVTHAADRPTVTIGVLKFGTVSWELDVIRHHRLDEAAGFELKQMDLASGQAAQIALQGGAVDMIASDWLWVARQRAAGADLTFIPHSAAVGALMVPAASPIASVADLKGRRIGVAGTPIDKSWLLLKALARDRYALDLDAAATPVFVAPPLLNQKAATGELDAVLNFWPYAARLQAAGMRTVIGVDGMMRDLGLSAQVPAVGFVFHEGWAKANPAALDAFVAASRKAKAIMAQSDAEWDRLRPLMTAEDEATWAALRDQFRAGIPNRWTEEEREAAAKLYGLMAKLGGRELVGTAMALPDGTFWPGVHF
ncbi:MULTISPECIES: ABC transporter substrate-binding protein [Azospirillum]|uniref:ABC transporter substrate-binding protein n=2 Tax=Azospirillum brasilense TaxID=192 RepID=A0ABU4P657_AZOBR|nr:MULTISPECIES: ABC transporter substrate-binding protein [Azospirillum]MDW7554075.1 ABC transporter substrate-binding protein [Azospirillum brasilense]MDW7592958.1 ABC transporter substrate-binding protein [Azospirillum brasilense]MDW7593666.1 ABC transporter substrate-binding protein [Azospirillum brasilense]MDW7627091.1 ABC transporter substrate-binding protein [Azospirillum brasilense]MDX5953205.1 ABC transporter substrate-binding protein [Azospirillum brasilense]